jgi:hypothetical protein
MAESINGSVAGITGYIYDGLNRTTQIYQYGTGASEKLANFNYNAAGELTQLTRFQDLANPQIVVKITYSYDLNGRLTNLIYQNNTGVLANDTLAYDTANRLTQFNTGSNSVTFRFATRLDFSKYINRHGWIISIFLEFQSGIPY